MRGTEDLTPEQRPRRRKRTRREQPYRRGRRKRADTLGPTLSAMLAGAPAYLPNPADFDRARQRRAKPRRGGRRAL